MVHEDGGNKDREKRAFQAGIRIEREYNKNVHVQTSRHFGFRVFWALLEGRRCPGFAPVWAGAIQLQKTTFPQMDLQKDIRDCVQYEFNLIRVCSARIVRIDLLRCRTLIETNEALKEVLAS